jgi:hypothetical protein
MHYERNGLVADNASSTEIQEEAGYMLPRRDRKQWETFSIASSSSSSTH